MKTNRILMYWLRQSGKVKQLQFFLALSLLVTALLLFQIVQINLETKNNKHIKQSKSNENHIEISESELKNFAESYLNSFFSTQEENLDFVKTHTNTKLFQTVLEKELNTRKNQGISGKYVSNHIYLEPIDDSQAKAICFGKEHFPNNDYVDRELTVELLIFVPELKVVDIPVFKIE